jgi:hypothetical protein
MIATTIKKTALTLSLPALLFATPLHAQVKRLADENAIGWAAGFFTFNLNKKVALLAEYQWRRDHIITNWQQSLARGGIQYNFNKNVSAAIGYGYIITYPYGDYPAGPYTIPEHRIFEQLTWRDERGRLTLDHRFRLEQRFLGKVTQAAPEYDVTGWNYLNRVRYQLKATLPLNHKEMSDKTFYASAYNELFIGFGKNVNQNVFDQDRTTLQFGYKLNKTVRFDAGVLYQIVQQGALVSGVPAYQYNIGPILSLYCSF